MRGTSGTTDSQFNKLFFWPLSRVGGPDATKPYEFIGFGAMEVTKPYELIGFGAMDVTKPYKFIGLAADDLQSDRGVVLQVVSKKGEAFRFASGELRSDLVVVLEAAKQNCYIYMYFYFFCFL